MALGQKGSPRQSGIELLRILAMLGVVVLHYNNSAIGGGFANVPRGGGSMWLMYGLEGAAICAVDLFVLITGYFSCNQTALRPGKAFSLLVQVTVFQLLGYGIALCAGGEFDLRALVMRCVPNNYFVSLYVAMCLLAPYLNLMLHKLSPKALTGLVALCFALFAVFPTVTELADGMLREDFPGLSPISIRGSAAGYSLINFLMMYLIGAWLRLGDIRLQKRWSALIFAALTVALMLWGYIDKTDLALAYCNPLVIAQAVAAFLLFRQWNFQSRLVNSLATASFTCFLLHIALLGFYQIPQAVKQPAILVLAHILFTATTIYLIAWPVHYGYHFAMKWPIRSLQKLLRLDREYTVQTKEEVQ